MKLAGIVIFAYYTWTTVTNSYKCCNTHLLGSTFASPGSRCVRRPQRWSVRFFFARSPGSFNGSASFLYAPFRRPTSGRVRGQPFRDAVTRADRRQICVTAKCAKCIHGASHLEIFAPRHFNVPRTRRRFNIAVVVSFSVI